MKRLLLFLLPLMALFIASCSEEEQVALSTHIEEIKQNYTSAAYLSNNNCLYIYTEGYSSFPKKIHNEIAVMLEFRPPYDYITGEHKIDYCYIKRQHNYYNVVWMMENNRPTDGKIKITKQGDTYTINLTTPTMTDEQGATVPPQTITYKGPITNTTILES